ncbi:hypothetical protein [Candidatus Methylospira mobilis]|uniref:hypothetical protein n=1 Tax=Candidatus Methylospira mobilis TaxID=1808979 RepID=UPI00129409CD|nr:hypothetical protein [Candidatus Methylospira mobilis]
MPLHTGPSAGLERIYAMEGSLIFMLNCQATAKATQRFSLQLSSRSELDILL